MPPADRQLIQAPRSDQKPKPHNAWKGQEHEARFPTVADRVAQTVAAMFLERKVEPIFHPDSYGYRSKRSALDAVAKYRERCWENDWVVDLDVQKSSTACHGG